jgi:hypothetical protein
MELTLKELKEDHQKLNKEILSLLKSFQDKYDVEIIRVLTSENCYKAVQEKYYRIESINVEFKF